MAVGWSTGHAGLGALANGNGCLPRHSPSGHSGWTATAWARAWAEDKTTEKHLESLRTWLASEPELETRAAYDDFADTHNARLPTGAVPLVRASTINRGLPLSWENAIRVARRELPLEKAIKQDLAERLPVSDAETLVGLRLIARVLNEDAQGTRELAQEDPKFPVPIAHLDGRAAWFYEDVKLYRRGLAVP